MHPSPAAADQPVNSPLHTRRDALRRGAAALAGVGLAASSATAAGDSTPAASDQPGRLMGKVAVVTGAARGIGRATAVAIAREGADIMGIDIAGSVSSVTAYPAATMDELEETGKLVEGHGRRFFAVKADIRDLDALRKAAAQVTEKLSRLNIIVANAGIQGFKPLLEMEDKHWHDIIDVNPSGAANTLRAFAPLLVEAKAGGRVILVSSTQGRHGSKTPPRTRLPNGAFTA